MVDLVPRKPNNMMDKEELRGRGREELGDGSGEARVFIITNNDEAARLIGSGGERVTQLRKEFAEIKLRIGSKVPGVDEQVTEVQGPIERVTELLMRIAEITVEPRSDNDPMLTLLIHNAGGLIGTGGQRVTKIRKESGATIKIAKDNLPRSTQTPVTVTGRLQSLEQATRMIVEFTTTCEPVTRIYSPENAVVRRGRGDGRSGMGGRRRDRSRGRRGGDRDEGRDRWGDGRWRDRGRREVGGGGWPRRAERDFGDRGDRWSNRDGDRWPSRDEGRRGAGYGGRSGGGWGPRDRAENNRRDDYDPFEPTSSRRGNGDWDRPKGRFDGWQSSNDDQRGWGPQGDVERGWGPSRSAAGGGGGGWGGPPNVGWGGPPERSGRDYGGPIAGGGW